jgi:hypothetical protein
VPVLLDVEVRALVSAVAPIVGVTAERLAAGPVGGLRGAKVRERDGRVALIVGVAGLAQQPAAGVIVCGSSPSPRSETAASPFGRSRQHRDRDDRDERQPVPDLKQLHFHVGSSMIFSAATAMSSYSPATASIFPRGSSDRNVSAIVRHSSARSL